MWIHFSYELENWYLSSMGKQNMRFNFVKREYILFIWIKKTFRKAEASKKDSFASLIFIIKSFELQFKVLLGKMLSHLTCPWKLHKRLAENLKPIF